MILAELIVQKSKKLKEVPDKLLSRTEKAQKEIFEKMIVKLGRLKTNADGSFIVSEENLKIASEITQDLKGIVLESEYVDAVKEFRDQFDKLGTLNEKYFKTAFPDFTPSEVTSSILSRSKKLVVKNLISSSLDKEFLLPIEGLLNDAISSGAGMLDTVKQIRNFIEGGKNAAGADVDGKILKYSKVIAHDAFAVADANYTNAVAEELETEWYFIDGPELDDSRCFCLERKGKYFHYKEIEGWARGENVGECNFPWNGFRDGTNESTIFVFRGGWGCQDAYMPVSIVAVPKEVIERNIESGNFVPSEFEKAELQL